MHRVNKGIESDVGERARLACRNVAKQMRDDPLRQVVGFDLVVDRQLLQRRNQPPMPTDDPPDQPGMTEVVEAAPLAITLSCGVDQCQVFGCAHTVLLLGLQKTLLQRHGNGFGKADANKPAGGDGVAIMDQAHRLFGSDDLVTPRVARLMVLDRKMHGLPR